jgi:hypothetical protein
MNCVIKLIYNSGQPSSYSLKFTEDHLWVDLHLASLPGDFLTIETRLRDDLILKRHYNVIFITKTIPDKIANTKEFLSFKETLLRIFGKSENPNQDTWIQIIQMHLTKGKNPDLSNFEDPATLVKISNYFQSILNTKITKGQVVELCQKLISDNSDHPL